MPGNAGRGVLHGLSELWRSTCRPAVFRRCATIALVVGTLLSLVNQGDALLAGRFDRVLALRVLANYLIPFVVSNLGAMPSLPSRQEQDNIRLVRRQRDRRRERAR